MGQNERPDPPSAGAVATPYVGPGGETLWEWNVCPDCGKVGAHYSDKQGRRGIRCG